MKSLNKYRIYRISDGHRVCTRHLYTDGKGVIHIRKGYGESRIFWVKVDFDKYFVERVYTFQEKIEKSQKKTRFRRFWGKVVSLYRGFLLVT